LETGSIHKKLSPSIGLANNIATMHMITGYRQFITHASKVHNEKDHNASTDRSSIVPHCTITSTDDELDDEYLNTGENKKVSLLLDGPTGLEESHAPEVHFSSTSAELLHWHGLAAPQ
jgi:hypothetical protein